MSLSASDYRKLLDIVDTAYALPDQNAVFEAVCDKLQRLIGVTSAVYIPWNKAARTFDADGHALFDAPYEPLRLFIAHYAPHHPVVASGSHVSAAFRRGVKITDFVSARQFAENPYARDCSSLTPHFYEMCISLAAQGDMIGTIGFHRKRHEGDFSERARNVVTALIPHLARAIHHAELTRAIAAAQGLGVVVIDASGTAVMMNPEALRILAGRPPESLPDPGSGLAPAFLRTETGVYRVRTARLRWSERAKIVLLERAAPDPRPALAALPLTPRQREVAALAIEGHANFEIAKRLGLSEHTVKDHLRDVFERLSVRSRSALTARVLGLDGSGAR